MNKNLLSILTLVAVLLLAACGPGKGAFSVDGTKPVSQENRIIYQLNVGAFTPEGTFKAAEGQLARLDTLGVDILWLMPIYPRGAMMHSPYASMDFLQVNPAYGTVADLKAFVAAAHEYGMKVWLDWVPNHVAVENPWVTEHPEYFTKDSKGQMIHPHGWGDVYELNYQDEGLVNAMNTALKFWIDEADVDGFRCDYVSSPTIPVSYWQDIIAKLKSKNKTIEFLSETDISDSYNQRIDSCGFDYDYAWDFQEDLVRKFGAEGTSADSLRNIVDKFLTASQQIKNRRMVYLTNHDQNYNDGGHTLKDFYGDNRYALTVLQFTLYGAELFHRRQGQMAAGRLQDAAPGAHPLCPAPHTALAGCRCPGSRVFSHGQPPCAGLSARPRACGAESRHRRGGGEICPQRTWNIHPVARQPHHRRWACRHGCLSRRKRPHRP